MKKIKIHTNRLQNDSNQIKSCIINMKSEMANMKESVSQLDQMWDGPSSEALKKVFQDDMNALNTIISNLNKIFEYETTAKTKYEECEGKVSELIAGIRI
ncbi:MAG: WXG100 family type VII secretion target [Lachnospiraceae bacterium]|nr:WXG100 family type VII secretion target [Lachnospiraceae bacterium]